MSLHADLMAAGRDVLQAVHGGAVAEYSPPRGEAQHWPIIARGEVQVDERDFVEGDFNHQERHERITVKVRGGDQVRPALEGHVRLPGDEVPWSIDSFGGLGTAIVRLELKRGLPSKIGREGRFR